MPYRRGYRSTHLDTYSKCIKNTFKVHLKMYLDYIYSAFTERLQSIYSAFKKHLEKSNVAFKTHWNCI